MEQITKQQVILIALLVAIITAISTSVATVSLLDDPNSSGSQQTIYKVIEKSIETVANIPSAKEAPVQTKNTPAPLSPSDIASSGAKSMVRIYDVGSGDKRFVALGIAVGAKNAVLASKLEIDNSFASQYVVDTSDGREISAKLEKGDVAGSFNVFTILYDPKEKSKVPSIDIKDSKSLTLGSNVVALGGKESGNVVSTGIVQEFASSGSDASTTKSIITDMTLSSGLSGWLLFDTSGSLVAFEKPVEEGKSPEFVPGSLVKASIAQYL